MKNLHKAVAVMAVSLVAAACLLTLKPVRAFASQEGSYIYHSLFVNGPAVVYGASTAVTGSDGTARLGVSVTTGTPAAMSGVFALRFLGAVGAKPATSNEGDFAYDVSLHSIIIATKTSTSNDGWIKAVTSNAAWTTY